MVIAGLHIILYILLYIRGSHQIIPREYVSSFYGTRLIPLLFSVYNENDSVSHPFQRNFILCQRYLLDVKLTDTNFHASI